MKSPVKVDLSSAVVAYRPAAGEERSFPARAVQAKALFDSLVRTFLNGKLRDPFAKFGVGWGNRFERQLERFVPVVLDANGSFTEAVDHLVATKLVRKLEDRFGVRPEDLDAFADKIEKLWEGLDQEAPSKTTSRIRKEASRLRGGYGS